MSVFVAQNHGAGKKERVRDGLRKGLSVMFTLATGIGWIAVEVYQFVIYKKQLSVGFF